MSKCKLRARFLVAGFALYDAFIIQFCLYLTI